MMMIGFEQILNIHTPLPPLSSQFFLFAILQFSSKKILILGRKILDRHSPFLAPFEFRLCWHVKWRYRLPLTNIFIFVFCLRTSCTYFLFNKLKKTHTVAELTHFLFSDIIMNKQYQIGFATFLMSKDEWLY